MRESIAASVPAFINHAAQGDASVAMRQWDNRVAPISLAAIEGFGRSINLRHGNLLEFRITSMVTGGAFTSPTLEVAGTYVFAGRELPGSAVFSAMSPSPVRMPMLRLRSLVIDDPDIGRMQLPEAASSASAPARP
jgi:hypothetical protein